MQMGLYVYSLNCTDFWFAPTGNQNIVSDDDTDNQGEIGFGMQKKVANSHRRYRGLA